MNSESNTLNDSAAAASKASRFAQKATDAVNPEHSTMKRTGAALSAVSLGVRYLPVAMRLFRRYPFGASVALAGAAWAFVAMRSRRNRQFVP